MDAYRVFLSTRFEIFLEKVFSFKFKKLIILISLLSTNH